MSDVTEQNFPSSLCIISYSIILFSFLLSLRSCAVLKSLKGLIDTHTHTHYMSIRLLLTLYPLFLPCSLCVLDFVMLSKGGKEERKGEREVQKKKNKIKNERKWRKKKRQKDEDSRQTKKRNEARKGKQTKESRTEMTKELNIMKKERKISNEDREKKRTGTKGIQIKIRWRKTDRKLRKGRKEGGGERKEGSSQTESGQEAS